MAPLSDRLSPKATICVIGGVVGVGGGVVGVGGGMVDVAGGMVGVAGGLACFEQPEASIVSRITKIRIFR